MLSFWVDFPGIPALMVMAGRKPCFVVHQANASFTAVTISDAANTSLQHPCCKLLYIANNGEVEIMERSKSRTDDCAGPICVPAPHQVYPKQRRRSGRSRCQLQLAWPLGPLTRLLMEADGVTEIELTEILQRVVAARSGLL